MAKATSATDALFAEYRRTAPRLDLEFLTAHTRTVKMPYALLQDCIAEHASCVRDEPKGTRHAQHARAVAVLTSRYWQHVARVAGWESQRDRDRYFVDLEFQDRSAERDALIAELGPCAVSAEEFDRAAAAFDQRAAGTAAA